MKSKNAQLVGEVSSSNTTTPLKKKGKEARGTCVIHLGRSNATMKAQSWYICLHANLRLNKVGFLLVKQPPPQELNIRPFLRIGEVENLPNILYLICFPIIRLSLHLVIEPLHKLSFALRWRATWHLSGDVIAM